MKDAQGFRTALFGRCKEIAAERKVPTDALLDLLKKVGEEIHEAGIDGIYATESVDPDAYDVTWLTLLAVKLSNWAFVVQCSGGGGGDQDPVRRRA